MRSCHLCRHLSEYHVLHFWIYHHVETKSRVQRDNYMAGVVSTGYQNQDYPVDLMDREKFHGMHINDIYSLMQDTKA